MLKADKLPAAEDLGFVGEIREVNTKIVEDAIASGYTLYLHGGGRLPR